MITKLLRYLKLGLWFSIILFYFFYIINFLIVAWSPSPSREIAEMEWEKREKKIQLYKMLTKAFNYGI